MTCSEIPFGKCYKKDVRFRFLELDVIDASHMIEEWLFGLLPIRDRGIRS